MFFEKVESGCLSPITGLLATPERRDRKWAPATRSRRPRLGMREGAYAVSSVSSVTLLPHLHHR